MLIDEEDEHKMEEMMTKNLADCSLMSMKPRNAIFTNILAVIPSIKLLQSDFPSLMVTALTTKLLSERLR